MRSNASTTYGFTSAAVHRRREASLPLAQAVRSTQNLCQVSFAIGIIVGPSKQLPHRHVLGCEHAEWGSQGSHQMRSQHMLPSTAASPAPIEEDTLNNFDAQQVSQAPPRRQGNCVGRSLVGVRLEDRISFAWALGNKKNGSQSARKQTIALATMFGKNASC